MAVVAPFLYQCDDIIVILKEISGYTSYTIENATLSILVPLVNIRLYLYLFTVHAKN